MKLNLVFLVLLSVFSLGCSERVFTAPLRATLIDPSLGIEAVPAYLGDEYVSHFNRYTKVMTPDGVSIHILAQSQLTNEQVVRARSVLEHYLTNLPGSLYGEDKSAVANKMAENNAMLLLLNGEGDGKNPASELAGQPLYQNEIQVEGGRWYINQDYSHRDATFEEICIWFMIQVLAWMVVAGFQVHFPAFKQKFGQHKKTA